MVIIERSSIVMLQFFWMSLIPVWIVKSWRVCQHFCFALLFRAVSLKGPLSALSVVFFVSLGLPCLLAIQYLHWLLLAPITLSCNFVASSQINPEIPSWLWHSYQVSFCPPRCVWAWLPLDSILSMDLICFGWLRFALAQTHASKSSGYKPSLIETTKRLTHCLYLQLWHRSFGCFDPQQGCFVSRLFTSHRPAASSLH